MLLFYIIMLYVGLGVLFYIPFIIKGIVITDPDTKGSSLIFRLMLFPGVLIFWPLLLGRWLNNLK